MDPISWLIALITPILAPITNSPLFSFVTGISSFLEKLIQIFSDPPKVLCYSLRSFSLVEDKVQDSSIQIRYKDQVIPRLTLTRIAIWNGGREIIRHQDDIPTKEPLKIQLNTGKILKLDLLDIQKPANDFHCEVCIGITKEALITFEYLDKKEGATIQIIHTGNLHDYDTKDKNKEIKFLGDTVKGGKVRKVSYTKSRENTPIYWSALASAIVATLVNLILIILFSFYLKITNTSWYTVAFIIVFTLVFNFIFALLEEQVLYKYIARIPKRFKKFHEQSWKL